MNNSFGDMIRHAPFTIVKHVGLTFLSAGLGGFPAAQSDSRDWKVPRTGRLESLPYIHTPGVGISFCIALMFHVFGTSDIALAQPIELPKLQPPHDEIGPTFWEQHHWHIVIAAAAVLALAALLIWWLRRPKQAVVVPPELAAKRALEALRGRQEDGALVVEVSRVMRHYLIPVFKLPLGELTTGELVQTLRTHLEIDRGLVAAIGSFLRRCDEWKFAPTPLPPQMGIVARAEELVEDIEKHRRQPPRTAPPPLPTAVSSQATS